MEKNLPFLCIDRINIVKMTILPSAIYRFSAMHKIPMSWKQIDENVELVTAMLFTEIRESRVEA
jgi:hypothetical protein